MSDPAPVVALVWASEAADDPRPALAARERTLPSGAIHVVFRVCDEPVRLYEGPDAAAPVDLGFGVAGGPRTRAYLRDTSRPVSTVGLQLAPGAARAVLGVPAELLAERHVSIEDLWGPSARTLRDRLCEAPVAERTRVLRAFVQSRARGGPDPLVAHVLAGLRRGVPLRDLYDGTGYSERHVVTRFRQEVGITPKRYARLLRFQHALRLARRLPWAEVALAAGYFDQAHLVREFRSFAGISPTAWRPAAADHPLHVPEPP